MISKKNPLIQSSAYQELVVKTLATKQVLDPNALFECRDLSELTIEDDLLGYVRRHANDDDPITS